MSQNVAEQAEEEMRHMGHCSQVRGLDVDRELLAVQKCGKIIHE